MGFRGIERSTGVCHNTVINWVKEASSQIPEENYEIFETAQIDELYAKRYPLGQTFVGSKKTKFPKGYRFAYGFGQQSTLQTADILKWVVGDRSPETFRNLWWIIRGWCCFLYITDGWKVYPCFIDDCDHLVSKTVMTLSRRRKFTIASLSCSFTSQNILLF